MFRTGLALFAVVAFTAAAAAAPMKTSSDVVKITATGGKIENDKQTITITLQIEKPWHVYANPVGVMDLADNATVVNITGKTKPQSVKIAYPPGKEEKDEVVGNYMIYEDKVVITAHVVRAKGDTEPLNATVKIQACRTEKGGGGMCLQGSTVEVKDIK